MKKWIIFLLSVFMFCSAPVFAGVKGIYITSSTMEDTQEINYLVERAKATGINTFIVDVERPSKRYPDNLALLKKNGIRFVARIVVFPNGGTHERVTSIPYREGKYKLIELALGYGADAIQLDYIRYNTSLGRSDQHVTNVSNVIAWFKERLARNNVPLEVDVFGITSFGPEKHIGQDVRRIAAHADALCPMNYPSHFQPFAPHSARPWQTVYDALVALKSQFNNNAPVPIVAWIEMSNYHYILTGRAKQKYIAAQIRAVNDSGVAGWYAWSPGNQYDNLFAVLESGQDKQGRGDG